MDYTKVISTVKKYAFAIVNELGGVLDDIATKLDSLPQDVQSVKNAFDAWKADWTQARAIKLDNLDAKVSTRATAADMGTALEQINVLLGKGTVKSVQRGVVQWASTNKLFGKEVTVNLAQVNPSKTIVLLQASHGKFNSDGNYVAQASLASLSATSMQLNVTVLCNAAPYFSNSTIYASWQVIEFY